MRHKSNVDAPNEDGETSLMRVAGYASSSERLKLLIQRGAKINAKNRRGEPALDLALRSDTGAESKRVLRELGAVGAKGR